MATRIEQLARPKPDLLRFPDRRSVYWLDELSPETNGSTTTTELLECSETRISLQMRTPLTPDNAWPICIITWNSQEHIIKLMPRWSNLCVRKQMNAGFEQSRPSSQWEVSVGAQRARPSDRVCSLALPRLPTVGWKPERLLLASSSRAVQTAVASPRICQLACPKRRPGLHSPHPSKTSLAPHSPKTASSRLQLLAIPKSDHPQYHRDRPVSWPVPKSVREAVASERVHVLSEPKQRKALYQGYDPYMVTLAARSASATPRLLELCLPLPRKCEAK